MHLAGIQAAQAGARAAGAAPPAAAPPAGQGLCVDIDATITIDHSDRKEAPRPHGPVDRPDIAGGEALAGLLRAGNAGSNTTAVLDQALGRAAVGASAAAR